MNRDQTDFVNIEVSEHDFLDGRPYIEDDYPPDIYTTEDFREQVKFGNFNEYDGTGYWAVNGVTSRTPVDLSKLVKGDFEPGFTHIEWFNK